MEGQEGVGENPEASPAEAPQEQPQEAEASQGANADGGESEGADVENWEPDSPKAKRRWKKMLEERNQLRNAVGQYQKLGGDYKGAIALHRMLSQNPDKLTKVMEILHGREQGEQTDPYKDYDPDVAKKFQELDELKQWKATQEQSRQESEQMGITENRQALDLEFEQMLMKDGYVKDDGKAVDDTLADLLANATLATLQRKAQNPDKPTRSELQMAYKEVKQGLAYLEKASLNKMVKPSVPPSGTPSGAPVPQANQRTEEQRIAEIAGML